ncbi:hypothetical protein V6N13_148570 [Hibiscus sabdariffa]
MTTEEDICEQNDRTGGSMNWEPNDNIVRRGSAQQVCKMSHVRWKKKSQRAAEEANQMPRNDPFQSSGRPSLTCLRAEAVDHFLNLLVTVYRKYISTNVIQSRIYYE